MSWQDICHAPDPQHVKKCLLLYLYQAPFCLALYKSEFETSLKPSTRTVDYVQMAFCISWVNDIIAVIQITIKRGNLRDVVIMYFVWDCCSSDSTRASI